MTVALYGVRFPLEYYERTEVSPPGTPIERATDHAESVLRRICVKNGLTDPVVLIHQDDGCLVLEVLA